MGRPSKAREMGLEGKIVDMHDKELMSHAEIADELSREGKEISRESVRRSYVSSARKAEKYKIAAESCKVVLDSVKDGSNMDMVEASTSILTNMFYDKILQMENLDFDSSKDFITAIKSVGDMQVKVSRFRLSFDRGVEKAKQAIYDELALSFASDPEALQKLGKIVFAVEVHE